jgi:hypothetical protein
MPGGYVARDANGQTLAFVYPRENEAASAGFWINSISRQLAASNDVPWSASRRSAGRRDSYPPGYSQPAGRCAYRLTECTTAAEGGPRVISAPGANERQANLGELSGGVPGSPNNGGGGRLAVIPGRGQVNVEPAESTHSVKQRGQSPAMTPFRFIIEGARRRGRQLRHPVAL